MFKGNLAFCEIGSGAEDKIKILINENVKLYFPIDISGNLLLMHQKN